jgi:hypothetical protein
MPPRTGKKVKPKVRAKPKPQLLSARLTEHELAEYRYRYQSVQHYKILLLALERDPMAYQKQIREAYALPEEFLIDLETGELRWEMSRLEKLHAEQNNGR